MPIFFYLVAIFIIVIIVKEDQREWPGFSWPLWIPLAWLVITTTRIMVLLFPSGQGYLESAEFLTQQAEGNPLIRNTLLVLIFLGVIALRNRKSHLLLMLQQCKWFFILHSYALISIAWAAYPEVSIKRFIKLVGLVVIASIIALEKEHHRAFEHVLRRYIAICLTVSIFLLQFGKGTAYVTGRMGTRFLAGIASHKNVLAIICAVSLVFFVWRIFKTKFTLFNIDAPLLLIGSYLLVKAGSATGYVAAFIGLILVVISIIAKGNLRKLFLLGLAAFVPLVLILSIAVQSPFSALSNEFFSSVDRDASLTGRIPLWEAVINLGRSELLLGSGYESFWMEKLPIIWDMFRSGPVNAHSGYVDLLVNLGAVGLIIFIVFLVNLGRQLLKAANQGNRYNSLFIILFFIVLLGNITESSFMVLSLHWSLVVIIALSASKIDLQGAPSADELPS